MPMIVVMLVKKAVYYILAAGPFLLLGIIAINSRFNTNHWEFPEYGPEATARIRAYVGPVTLTRKALETGDDAVLAQTVGVWIAGGQSGKLREVPTLTTVGGGSTYVSDQIAEARQSLVSAVLARADQRARSGVYREAAQLYLKAIEVSSVGKYSEFVGLADAAASQLDALGGLGEVVPFLDNEDQQMVRSELGRLVPEKGNAFADLSDRFAVAYSRDLRRIGRSTSVLEAARQRHLLASTDTVSESPLRGWEALSNGDRTLVTLYSRSRVAEMVELRYQSELAELVGLLSSN